VPLFITLDEPDDLSIALPDDGRVENLTGRRAMINPGSVGQPRDGDPDAAFALLDMDSLTWEFRRVPYPIEETQQQMREHDFPESLVARLSFGW
jgi:diadenosine tetraphosphatase ApaH/serine/threonine PP2A family protein phosphatase